MTYANPNIQRMTPYCPPLDNRTSYEGMLLDFNERTVQVSPKVRAALVEYAQTGKFRVYPEYYDLCARIGDYAGVSSNQVMISNGSDQGIELVFRTFTAQGDTVVIPSPSFAMFDQCAGIQGNKIIRPLYEGDDLRFPAEQILSAIDDRVKLIVTCNPNNPTGTLASLEDIERIAKAAPNAIVMVDEAYFEFSGVTAVELISRYPNIIVTRTFSKAFGLAAFRIGYLIASPENINELLKVRGPYDINVPATVVVRASLENRTETEAYIDEVMTESKPMLEAFFEAANVPYIPSQANFILFRVNDVQATYNALDKAGIRVRPRKGPGIENTVRVSIGTVQQTTSFIQIYKTLFL